jgi:SGNH domain (fused to AT3 domains)
VIPHRWITILLALGLVLVTPSVAAGADSDRDGLRDGFEQRSGVSDPDDRDSDDDGLIDAAEDRDNDRVSNLGEQRFRTHPGRRDSDGDGVADGNEDADRDGRSNAREQDARPLPGGLKPSLGEARTAWPAIRAACQTAHGEAAIHPCRSGDRKGETLVVLFGDSHATQWQPALSRAGKREGWRVVMITKTGCPSVHVNPAGQRALDGGVSCAAWRARGLRWIREHGADVVIVTNLDAYPVSRAAWRAGLRRTLMALPRRAERVVLADTPRLRIDPVSCLRRHPTNIAACVTGRGDAMHRSHDRSEQAAARAAGASFISLSWKVCPYDPCPLVIGDTLLWRDNAHITARFSRELGPSMRTKLAPLVGSTEPVSAGPDGTIIDLVGYRPGLSSIRESEP